MQNLFSNQETVEYRSSAEAMLRRLLMSSYVAYPFGRGFVFVRLESISVESPPMAYRAERLLNFDNAVLLKRA